MAIKILLVDDNAVVRRALRFSIESQTDWEISGEAENGKVAVELVQQSSPDVIILDLSMPVMNGLDAARKIRALAPSAGILLFTLHACPQLVEDARKVGIDEVLSKSGGLGATVLGAVRSLLPGSNVSRAASC
jgi:DNA-binding NarL/FixJ family response regulator